MKSQHEFSQVPTQSVSRSTFNLSHGLKTTFDADLLIPILGPIDIIPGDTFNVKSSHFIRLATPLFPIMDSMYFETQFFFVPYRTIWTNFEKFHGAQDDPGDSIAFTIPVCSGGPCSLHDLADYMGIPLLLDPDNIDVSALPFRAFRKIFNEWYRDENLIDSLNVATGDGPDTQSVTGFDATPPKRGKRFDYFTSCLPAPQKGTAVSMPLGTSADIHTAASEDETIVIFSEGENDFREIYAPTPVPSDILIDTNAAADQTKKLFADLSTALAPTINDIRLAFQTQRLLERDARSGTRYVEALKAHWGVTSPDHRLQRAEYLGGGSSRVGITPVSNTSDTATKEQGSLAGFGTSSGTTGFSKSFVEHGVLLGIGSVRADITYSQGLDRMWSKATRFDFYYPVLQGIGEQAVLQKEVWVTGAGTPAEDELVFGYQERYGEYRRQQSRITGLFRPDAASTLAAWHLSEDFATAPTLGETFITSNLGVPLDRAIAVSTEPHFIGDFFFDIKAARPMPTYGVPGGIDRF